MIKDLTKGSIIKNLLKVSLPIMGASLFQMAYQIIDMFFLGKLSSDSVAAVGTAGFYIGLSYALATLSFIGVGIKVSQSIGEKRNKKALEYILASIVLISIISITITIVIFSFRENLIGFFNLKSGYIHSGAVNYLKIVILFSIFKNLNLNFNRIFIGFGNGKIPFIIGSLALVLNIILDPILIFGLKNVPGYGIEGAAYATVISQVLATLIYLLIFVKNIKREIKANIRVKLSYIKEIIKLSYPVTLQRVIFTTTSIIIGKIISKWGSDAIAIQKIGIQLESISWVTAGGMQAAITSFIGQNYGAKRIKRLKKGYYTAITIMTAVGLIVSLLFLIVPREIFSLFVKEPRVVEGGVIYLRILAVSQVFMCIDITTMGAFNGIGKTGIPPINSVVLTTLRIPLSILFSTVFLMGVSGIWLSISLTTILKGIILLSIFLYFIKKLEKETYI